MKAEHVITSYELTDEPDPIYDGSPADSDGPRIYGLPEIDPPSEAELAAIEQESGFDDPEQVTAEHEEPSSEAEAHYESDNSATVSALGIFMKHAGKFPLLTGPQEVKLAKRIEKGDLEAKELMVDSNLRLVVSMSKSYENQGLPKMDVIQEGCLGLIRAAEKFDYRKGFKFSTYATWWIRQAITRGIGNTGRGIRIPLHEHQKAGKIKKTETALTNQLGREPTLEELAAETRFETEKIAFLKRMTETPTSLNKPVGEGGDEFGSLIPEDTAEEDPGLEAAAYSIKREALQEAREGLSSNERYVLEKRNGMDDEPPQTLNEIGISLHITRERVRQIERNAERRLLTILQANPELSARVRDPADYVPDEEARQKA